MLARMENRQIHSGTAKQKWIMGEQKATGKGGNSEMERTGG